MMVHEHPLCATRCVRYLHAAPDSATGIKVDGVIFERKLDCKGREKHNTIPFLNKNLTEYQKYVANATSPSGTTHLVELHIITNPSPAWILRWPGRGQRCHVGHAIGPKDSTDEINPLILL